MADNGKYDALDLSQLEQNTGEDELKDAILYIEHDYLTLRTHTGRLLRELRTDKLDMGVYLSEFLSGDDH